MSIPPGYALFNRHNGSLLRYGILLSCACIAACGPASPPVPPAPQAAVAPPPEPIKPGKTRKPARVAQPPLSAKPVYQADTYLRQLSLARLALADGGDAPVPSAGLGVIDGYAAQPPMPETQLVAVLEYTGKDKKVTHAVLAPIGLSPQQADFPYLMEIISRLDAAGTLYDIHPAMVTVTPAAMPALSGASGERLQKQLDGRQESVLETARKLPSLEDVRIQLRLVHFFIDHRFRDAAYLCVDNVKLALAATKADNDADRDNIRALLHELDALEGRLHETMPYTL